MLEAYTIKEDGVTSTGDNGQFSADRIITEGEGGCGTGNAPMREGRERLLSLEPRRPPAERGVGFHPRHTAWRFTPTFGQRRISTGRSLPSESWSI